MPQGISIHIGLNRVDPNAYDSSWDGKLVGAVQDAEDMYAIAQSQGFQSTKLLEQAATREAVIQAIRTSGEVLLTGDILLLTFAGHGGVLPDVSGDESDHQDETWCLYDGHLLDDELYLLWQTFTRGVRILVISDSCHSGTVVRGAELGLQRAMSRDVAIDTWQNNRDFYRDLLDTTKGINANKPPLASVRLLSACREDRSAYDGKPNGFFTQTLKQVWDNGNFDGTYAGFYDKIYDQMYRYQAPEHVFIGQADPTFDSQKPFQIN